MIKYIQLIHKNEDNERRTDKTFIKQIVYVLNQACHSLN